MSVGKKLRGLREKSGFSLREVKEQLFKINVVMPQNTLSGYELDKREPTYDKLEIFAKFYNVPVTYFFDNGKVINKDNKDSVIEELMNRLVDENIIIDPTNISAELANTIISTVQSDLVFRRMKKKRAED